MISNVHQRLLPASIEQVWALIEAVAEPGNALWPAPPWPAMLLDRPLAVGAKGGHGPVRYVCVTLEPGRRVEFEFLPPTPLIGSHAFDLVEHPDGTVLRHTLLGTPRGITGELAWSLVFRWLHDAFMPDLLDRADTAAGRSPEEPAHWSPYVRLLLGGYELLATTTRTSRPSPTVVSPGPSSGA